MKHSTLLRQPPSFTRTTVWSSRHSEEESQRQRNYRLVEMDSLKNRGHPNIVEFYEWLEPRSDSKYYLASELAVDGGLFDRVPQRQNYRE
ncbi:hypothetical protein AZE42_09461 [Rhizopogon vesiculosus]|uniref:Protein kinase domain-containing protein n=1 Tax=Rhizopogon vesiculosus TaxID=180088 RepID=A0A1J8QER8_9AGAM|nr:hypothetical protein AZE42_09461 [Rhizopogon vesiculosus]